MLLDRTPVDEMVSGGAWMEVERQDIRFTVSGTGELKAAQSVNFRPPPIPHTWDFKIVQLAREGEMVEPGDTVLQFDPTEVLKMIREEQAELEKVQRELEKTRAISNFGIRTCSWSWRRRKLRTRRPPTN